MTDASHPRLGISVDSSWENNLEPIALLTASQFDSPCAFVALMVGKHLVHQATTGMLGRTEAMEGTIAGIATERGEPILISDLSADVELSRRPDVAGAPGYRAIATAPLRLRGRVVGALGGLWRERREFDAADRERLLALAACAEVILATQATKPDAGQQTMAESWRSMDGAGATERRLQLTQFTLDNLYADVLWVRKDGTIIYVNDTFCRRIGYSRKELLEKKPGDLDPAFDEERVAAIFEQVKQSGGMTIDTLPRRRDGSTYDSLVNLSYIRQGDEEFLCVIGQDITERKRTVEELQQTRRRLQAALIGGQIGLWEWNVSTNEVYVSPEFNAQLGESADTWDRIDDFQSRLHPDDVVAANKAIDDYLEGRSREYENVFRLRRVGGDYRWFLSRGCLFPNEHGEMIRFVGTHIDITDRKNDEARLAKDLIRSGRLLRATRELIVLESLSDLYDRVAKLVRDLVGAHQSAIRLRRGQSWNEGPDSFSMSNRYPDGQCWDRPLSDAGVYKWATALNKPIRLTQQDIESEALWAPVLALPSERRPANGWLAAPIVNRLGQNFGWLQVSDCAQGEFDRADLDMLIQVANIVSLVAERLQAEETAHERSKQVESALSESREKSAALRRSNEELERFAYVASHDLRAPLRGISNLVGWIFEDCEEEGVVLPEGVQTHLNMLQQQVARMDGLLTGLLEYSRAGRIRYDAEDVQLGDLIDEVASMVGLPKGFRVERPSAMPRIQAERSPLERVFLNLIANAAKHHDRDSGAIEIAFQEEGEFLQFTIADDGPGIPESQHERVFEMYQTLKSKDQVEGGGIGLSIVKKLVESSGGEISIAPGEGRGATMVFTWPKQVKKP